MGGIGSGGRREPRPGKKLGRPTTPEGARVQVSARVLPGTAARIKAEAEAEGVGVGVIMARVLDAWAKDTSTG
jgi:hypothetical protein